jgi:hypothetical protein
MAARHVIHRTYAITIPNCDPKALAQILREHMPEIEAQVRAQIRTQRVADRFNASLRRRRRTPKEKN